MKKVEMNNKRQCVKKKKGKIINTRYIFYGFLAFLFGITLSRNLYKGQLLYILLTVFSLISVLVGLILTKRFKMLAVIFAFFFLGNGLYFAGYNSFYNNTYEGNGVVVGRVSDKVYKTGNYWNIVLDNVTINGKKSKNLRLTITDYNDILSLQAGNVISFEGEIENVKLFQLGSFNVTSFRNNAPQQSFAYANEVVVTDYSQSLRYDEKIRANTHKLLRDNMSEENAEIAYSVLFGDKSFIDVELLDVYKFAGIAHILAVSGLHVGFLVALLYFLLKKLNKYIRFSILECVLILYCVLCGFTPSVLRASIMTTVILLAKLSGNRYDNLTSLSFAGFVIVLFNPLTALDAGFLMSYFSVASCFLLFKPVNNFLSKFIPNKIASVMSMTIVAQFGILPFVASFFQTFNFTSILVNMVAIPLLSILFPVLFIVCVLGLMLPFFGKLIILVDIGFKIINYVAQFFANSSLQIPLATFPIVFSILLWLGAFVLSRFLMINKMLKCFLISVIVFACCITMIVADVGSLQRNKIEYSDYAGQTLYIVNDKGESLLIGSNLKYSTLNKYAHLRGIKNLDYFVTLEDFEYNNTTCLGQACSSYFFYDNQFFTLQKEQKFTFGDYEIRYIYNDDKVAGVEVSFENHKIFFASCDKLSYNDDIINYLVTENCQFVFLNNQYILYSIDLKGTLFTDYKTQFTNYSLSKFGNMMITLKNQSFKVKCID